jgi:predicted acyl esterase
MNQNVTVQPFPMQIDWDVAIEMDDGLVVRADVYRPIGHGNYPALISYGPYGKGLHFEDGYKTAWDIMARDFPDTVANTSNIYQNWEVVDPEKWVPHGYVCIRVDSRGCGRTPGVIDHHSPREIRDFYQCIEWAAAQPWSNGRIGLAGISYYAANQWRVAELHPPHLVAICAWEGYADRYRDSSHHGGILSTFQKFWQAMQVMTVQHGLGRRGRKSRATGEWVCGPETLPEDELVRNVLPLWGELSGRELFDDYYKARSTDWSRVEVPLLSCGNWGGAGLHLRGNVEAFVRAAAKLKWLEIHGGTHWAVFYTDYANALQKRFFDHFLKGEDNGWDRQPKVLLNIRHPGEKFVRRDEAEWPLARTQWTRFYLRSDGNTLSRQPETGKADVSFQAFGDGLTFFSQPFETETEITGPLAAKLWVSSSTEDADLFLVFRLFDPEGREVTFQGALDPHAPVAQGWLRASHRKLDAKLSLPYRPYHSHDEKQPLTPGVPVELDIEIWPTCIVVPPGFRVALTVRGKDYEWDGPAETLSNMKHPMRGCGPFVHDEPADRPESVFGGTTTLHFGEGRQPYVLVPVIPAV